MADGLTFAIEIAAKLPDGDAVMAQLTAMASKLDAAGAASDAAAAAVAEGGKAYKAAEQAANRMALAVEKAALAGKDTTQLQAKADAAAAAVRREAQSLDALKASATAAKAAEAALAAESEKLVAATKEAAKAQEAAARAAPTRDVGELGKGLAKLPGPLGTVGRLLDDAGDVSEKVGGSFGKTGLAATAAAAGIAALVLAAVAIAAAIGTAIVKTAAWAVGLADAHRSSSLMTQALESTSAGLTGIGKAFPAISAATGQSSDQLRALAKQLDAAGVSAAKMPEALKAAALAETALGQGGSSAFIEKIKAAKGVVGDLASETEKQFGGVVSKQLLGLDQQTETFKRNLAGTFGGLKIDGLLTALSKVVALFDSNTESGKTMQKVFNEVFQPLIDAATAAIPIVASFLSGFVKGLDKIVTAMKPAAKALAALFGKPDDQLSDSFDTAAAAGAALASAIGFVAAGVGAVAFVVSAAIAPFVLLYKAGKAAFDGISEGVDAALGYLDGISLASVGGDMVQGLADGITGAGSAVLTAITGVVNGAIDSARALLKSHSPSQVFAALGGDVSEGFAMGVDDGAGEAQESMRSMVEPPPAPSTSVSSSSHSVTVLPGAIVINLQGAGKDALDELVATLEALLFQRGGAPA